MLIAFDAKRAVQNATGLGNYSRYVIDILCEHQTGNHYMLYAPNRRENQQLNQLIDISPQLSMRYPQGAWTHFTAAWRTWGIPADLVIDKVQIYHGLSNELPLSIKKAKGVKTVVTLHDIIFRRLPECYNAIDRITYNYKYSRSCRNADAVVAVSQRTKQDAMELWGIPEEKIHVIYQNCDETFSIRRNDDELHEVKKKYNLPNRYILNVGSIERRKNAMLAVKALPALPQDVDLVIVGRRTSYTSKIEKFASENRISDRVHILSDVPFEDLPAIYQQAEVFAYPSRYEGFGIPILEALASGLPGVAATGSCLEEAGGKGFIYVNPDDAEAMAGALNALLTDKDLRSSMLSAGKQHLASFSEQKQSDQLMALYRSLLAGK